MSLFHFLRHAHWPRWYFTLHDGRAYCGKCGPPDDAYTGTEPK